MSGNPATIRLVWIWTYRPSRSAKAAKPSGAYRQTSGTPIPAYVPNLWEPSFETSTSTNRSGGGSIVKSMFLMSRTRRLAFR
jgi:hypothetical protein